jgi:prepilin-type N-terminal cleavage/methylation domain-containing protein
MLVRPHTTARRTGLGFSLVELMVAILVAAILAAVALPSFRTTLQKHRLRVSVDNLQSAVQYARTEAVLRATYVSLCASADGATCSTAATYETGWLVYVHPVATTKASDVYTTTASAGMQILRATPALNAVTARAVDGAVVTFGQQGQLEPVASRTNASQPMALVLCAQNASSGALGANTTQVPGSRIGISPYGGIASTKLSGTDKCTP